MKSSNLIEVLKKSFPTLNVEKFVETKISAAVFDLWNYILEIGVQFYLIKVHNI